MYNFHSIGSCRVPVGLGASLPRVASLQHARKQASIRFIKIPFTKQTVVSHNSFSNSSSASFSKKSPVHTHRTLWGLYTGNKLGLVNTRTCLFPNLSLSLYRTLFTTTYTCNAREALQMSDDESDFGFSLGEDSDLVVKQPKVGFFRFPSCSLPLFLCIRS